VKCFWGVSVRDGGVPMFDIGPVELLPEMLEDTGVCFFYPLG